MPVVLPEPRIPLQWGLAPSSEEIASPRRNTTFSTSIPRLSHTTHFSSRGIARELGIHRETVRKYMDAESPPVSRRRTTSTVS